MANEPISKQAAPKSPANGVYAQSIAALRILIDGTVTDRTLPARADKPSRTIYEQKAIMVGGPTEMPFTITSFEHADTHVEGSYVLTAECVGLDDYGTPMLKKYAKKYIRVADLTDEQRQKFAPATTSLDDFQ
jgi:hypothetical protein